MLRYLTAGESHGKCLIGILEGMPAGLRIDKKSIDQDLARRQKGYGRGARMQIEKDQVQILSGVRKNMTIGSPIALLIENQDFKIDLLPAVVNARPGHADLAGVLKYGTHDIRDVLERASARDTAMQVAVGVLCKRLLAEFKIEILSQVTMIGSINADTEGLSIMQLKARCAKSLLNCADPKREKIMIDAIERAKRAGDSLGGVFEVIALGVPPGVGSYVQPDKRLDGCLAKSLMSISAIKAVEIGLGFLVALRPGSQVHDEIFYRQGKGFWRKTNHAGGIEGGMSNGEPIIARCAMKPIPTLSKPLHSVNIRTKNAAKAQVERADVCAVPAASVVGEAQVAITLAKAMTEKFGGDSLPEMKRNFSGYLKQVRNF
jgi:chorismate synthase